MTRERLRALAPLFAAVLLVAGAVWLQWDAAEREAADRAGAAASAAAREAIVTMGTYRPDTAEQSLTAARDRLTGQFLDAYTQAIQTVVIPGAKTKGMSSAVTVPALGVVSAQPGRVVLLAFVDQTLTVGADAPVSNPSRYRVTMDEVDGRWLLAGFDQI